MLLRNAPSLSKYRNDFSLKILDYFSNSKGGEEIGTLGKPVPIHLDLLSLLLPKLTLKDIKNICRKYPEDIVLQVMKILHRGFIFQDEIESCRDEIEKLLLEIGIEVPEVLQRDLEAHLEVFSVSLGKKLWESYKGNFGGNVEFHFSDGPPIRGHKSSTFKLK